jgi:trimeric autotransporter adhesin
VNQLGRGLIQKIASEQKIMKKSRMLILVGALFTAGSLAMSARAQSNLVYAAQYNQSTNRFGTINLLNGNFTQLSSLGNTLINDVAYCPTNGSVYGISNSSALVTFNKTNGTITTATKLSTGLQSLAFRPSDGALFGASQSALYKVNPATGTATSVGSYGSPKNLGSTGQNIRFAQDGNLYVSNTSTNTDIYRINTTNGAATWMGEAVGYPYLMLQNSSSNMYSVFINLGSATNLPPMLVTFDLSSFVVGGTNANGSTHQITVKLVGAGTNFPPNFTFSGGPSPVVTNLTVPVSATGFSNQTAVAGGNVTFSTTASGTGPYTYAWSKNGSTLSGQTNSSLMLNNVTTNDAATYSVIVGGAMGTVTNSATLTVNVPVTVTAAPFNQTVIAGGSATFSVTAAGTGLSYQWLFNGSVIGTSNSLTLNNVTTSQAGIYTMIVNGTCNSVTNSATLTVTKAVATVTLGSLNQAYSGSAKPATATTTPSGLAVTFTYNGSATVPTSAGSYTVVGTINDTNYTGSATGTLVIGQASGSITLGNLNQTYSGSAKPATATTTPSGLAVTFTYNSSATVPTSAGSYTVVGTINDANYTGSATGTLVIARATLTITATSNIKTYDGTTSAAAIPSVSGLQGSDTVTGLIEIYDTRNVGTSKTLSVTAYTVNDSNSGSNYSVSTVTSTAGVINPATLTITAAADTKTYDGSTSTIAIPTTGGLQGSDSVTGLTEAYDTRNAGAGKVLSVSAYTVNDGNSGNNYIVHTVANTQGMIEPAALTITAVPNTKIYDGTIFAAAVPTVTGLQGSDSVTGLAETYDTKDAGIGKTLSVSAYTINDGNSGNNYTVNAVSTAGTTNNIAKNSPGASGAINPAALTVTVDNKAKICGMSNPPLTASYNGFVNGESVNALSSPVVLTTTATTASDAGTYPITAGSAAAANYAIQYVNGTLLVAPAPQLAGAKISVNETEQYVVSYPTVAGLTYQLEYSTDLMSKWTPLGTPFAGTDGIVAVTNSINPTPQCFFRVQVLQGQ